MDTSPHATASPPRTGLILAAGLGTRLADETGPDQLKPLTAVGGEQLVLRAIRSLHAVGCARVVIVVGFQAETLRAAIEAGDSGGAELVFAPNPDYELANGLSVLAAREHIEGSFLLVMADHVVEAAVMQLAAAHHPPADGATLLVDYKLDTIFDMDDATKVWAADGRVVAIGKQLEDFNCVDTGVFVCTDALMAELDQVRRARGDASLSDGVQALARAGRMAVLDIGAGFWQDVDTPAMLHHAEAELARRAREPR